jgi:hypothetical protein
MIEVGRTYQRIYPYAFNRGWLREVIIREERSTGRSGGPLRIYFVGSDGNHYDSMGRRGSGGFIDPSDIFCRKYDLLVLSLGEMLEECLN